MANPAPPVTPSTATANAQPQTATDSIKAKLARISANTTLNQASDQNTQPPSPQYDQYNQRIYETAPTTLPQMFGSPLAQSGKYAIGPKGERQVSIPWSPPNSLGLTFFTVTGESVMACGDGTVESVGWLTFSGMGFSGGTPQAVEVNGIQQGPNGTIVDSSGNVVAQAGQAVTGGIYVTIKLGNTFPGYSVTYYNLNKTSVDKGDSVTQGQLVGLAGTSGPPGTPPQLALQVIYASGNQRVVVNPTVIVPNRNVTGPDSTNSQGGSPTLMPSAAPAGVQFQSSQAANVISAWDRSTQLQNKTVFDFKQAAAGYAQFVTQTNNVQQLALDNAVASFSANPPKVTAPMTFSFDTGLWSDGKPL